MQLACGTQVSVMSAAPNVGGCVVGAPQGQLFADGPRRLLLLLFAAHQIRSAQIADGRFGRFPGRREKLQSWQQCPVRSPASWPSPVLTAMADLLRMSATARASASWALQQSVRPAAGPSHRVAAAPQRRPGANPVRAWRQRQPADQRVGGRHFFRARLLVGAPAPCACLWGRVRAAPAVRPGGVRCPPSPSARSRSRGGRAVCGLCRAKCRRSSPERHGEQRGPAAPTPFASLEPAADIRVHGVGCGPGVRARPGRRPQIYPAATACTELHGATGGRC